MNNTAGELYRVNSKNNETKCNRIKSVLRHRQFKKPCLKNLERETDTHPFIARYRIPLPIDYTSRRMRWIGRSAAPDIYVVLRLQWAQRMMHATTEIAAAALSSEVFLRRNEDGTKSRRRYSSRRAQPPVRRD